MQLNRTKIARKGPRVRTMIESKVKQKNINLYDLLLESASDAIAMKLQRTAANQDGLKSLVACNRKRVSTVQAVVQTGSRI